MAEINSLTRQHISLRLRESRTLRRREEEKIVGNINPESIVEDEFIADENEGISVPSQLNQGELTSLVTIFRQRREWEKKADLFEDQNFDYVLTEGDTLEKINQFLKIIQSEITFTMKKFFAEMRLFFTDSSDQYFILKILLQRKNISRELKLKLNTALTFLEKTVDKKILKGGINTALKTRYFSSQLKISPWILRDSYRKFLENENEVLDIYYAWIFQFGYNKRSIILEFMESALLTDIMSSDPSCSKSEFGNLLGRIKQINLLYSAENILESQIKKDRLLWQLNPDESAWFQFFYCVIKAPQSVPEEINILVGKALPLLTHRERGMTLQQIYKLFLTIPFELFTNLEVKEELKQNIIRLMDISFKQQRIIN